MWIDGSTRLRYRGVRTFQAKGSHMATTKRALKAKRPKRVDRRKTTSTRITPETRAQLEAAAAHSGRSLAQEIEFRLERSFLDEDARNREMGGKELQALFRMLGAAAEIVQARTRKRWPQDWHTTHAIYMAWQHLIAHALPKPPKELAKVVSEHFGGQLKPLPPMPEPPDFLPDQRILSASKSHREEIDRKIYKAIWAEVLEKWTDCTTALAEREAAVEARAEAMKERERELRMILDRHEVAAAIGEGAASSLFPENETKG